MMGKGLGVLERDDVFKLAANAAGFPESFPLCVVGGAVIYVDANFG